MVRRRSWTVDELTKAVQTSFSYRQVLIKLNLREAGGNYEQVKKYIQEHRIYINHFKGKGWSKNLKGIGKPLRSLESILVKNSNYQSFKLKKRLFSEGLKQKNVRNVDGENTVTMDVYHLSLII